MKTSIESDAAAVGSTRRAPAEGADSSREPFAAGPSPPRSHVIAKAIDAATAAGSASTTWECLMTMPSSSTSSLRQLRADELPGARRAVLREEGFAGLVAEVEGVVDGAQQRLLSGGVGGELLRGGLDGGGLVGEAGGLRAGEHPREAAGQAEGVGGSLLAGGGEGGRFHRELAGEVVDEELRELLALELLRLGGRLLREGPECCDV